MPERPGPGKHEAPGHQARWVSAQMCVAAGDEPEGAVTDVDVRARGGHTAGIRLSDRL